MMLVQMQPRSAQTAPAPGTVRNWDPMDPAELQVCDDMTVEVALAVMAGARSAHLLVCDGDGLAAGRVTLARLTAVRESSAYTDRLRLRDVSGDGEPLTPATALTAGRALRLRRLGAPTATGGQEGPPGTPAPALALALA
ncbi:CBS domain-containing protein [Streptomyces sp. NPDC060232]|uniref:CBS domain-containing protein n=1 Tax=Streptomyces sp. NPDC060232 TaxID=3347079 RepID=UPI003655C3C3